MGIASGSTVFHLESAHQWGKDGKGAAQYNRVFLPFVKAVVEHRLIPSRQAFLDGVKVAVASDLELAKGKHEKRYTGGFAYLNELYALKDKGDQEFIPNDSRYGIVCLLPPGATGLNARTQVVPQSELLRPEQARTLFDRAYPPRFTGDAFMWMCDGTVIVTDSHENQDRPQAFDMPLGQGLVRTLRGTVGVHQYLIGKIAKDGQSFWFQTNGEYPDRDLVASVACSAKPEWRVVPSAAAREARWDDATKTLRFRLSHLHGPAEVDVRRSPAAR
jgi:hypothetical protein